MIATARINRTTLLCCVSGALSACSFVAFNLYAAVSQQVPAAAYVSLLFGLLTIAFGIASLCGKRDPISSGGRAYAWIGLALGAATLLAWVGIVLLVVSVELGAPL